MSIHKFNKTFKMVSLVVASKSTQDVQENPFANFFSKNIFILSSCGLWMPEKSAPFHRKILRYFYTFLLLLYIAIYQPTESAVMFFKPDLPKFLRSLRDQFNHFGCFYKMFTYFTNRKTILDVIDTMKNKKYMYEHYGYFDQNKIVERYKKQADKWMLTFLVFVNLICFNMTLLVCFIFVFYYESQYIEDENGNKLYVQPLAVNLVTPFEQHTRTGFILHFAFEIIPLEIHAWMIVGLDSLFTSLMGCLSAHLTILKDAFRTIRPRCIARLGLRNEEHLHDPPELQAEMQKEMKKCIRHLHMILDVAAKMEKIYNKQTLIQVLTSLFEMCLCLYFLSTSLDENVGPEITFLISTSFELLLYCWFGNEVTYASSQLPMAIFEGDWLSTNAKFKKCMIITMNRMMQPISMTIGKFTPLTYTTFLSISRIAYSFFTVLKSDALN